LSAKKAGNNDFAIRSEADVQLELHIENALEER
jgi:hypothetical protein